MPNNRCNFQYYNILLCYVTKYFPFLYTDGERNLTSIADDIPPQQLITDSQPRAHVNETDSGRNVVGNPTEVQPREGAVNVTVPIVKDRFNGTTTALHRWVEPSRDTQSSLRNVDFILEYNKNAQSFFAFNDQYRRLKIVILIQPGQSLPPGAFVLPEGYPAIIRHEVLYRYRPTAPIPGRLLSFCAQEAQGHHYYHQFHPRYIPKFYGMPSVTVIISRHNPSIIHHSSFIIPGISCGFSLLLPSQVGK